MGSVSLAFLMLPALAVQLLVPGLQGMAQDAAGMAALMGWMAPVALIALFGGAALTALALVPGISVGEALRLAAQRFWVVLLAMLLVGVIMVIGLTIFSFAGTLAGFSQEGLTALATVLTLLAGVALGARFLPLVPVAVLSRGGPVLALRHSWTLTAGHFWRLLGTSMLMLFLGLLVLTIARQTILGLAMLLALASDAGQVINAVATLLLVLISTSISTYCYVLIAGVYKQLARR